MLWTYRNVKQNEGEYDRLELALVLVYHLNDIGVRCCVKENVLS